MDKELENKLIAVLNSGNIEEEVLKLTVLDRFKILTSNNILTKILFDSIKKDFVLINEEESVDLYEYIDNMELNDIYDLTEDSHINFSIKFENLFIKKCTESSGDYYRDFMIKLIKNPEIQFDIINHLEDYIYENFDGISDEVLEKMLLDKKKRWKDSINGIVYYFKDDGYRLKYIDKFGIDFKVDTINSLKDERLKEQYLRDIPSNKRGLILKNLKNDEIKKKYFNGFTNYKAAVISSFEKDEDKIKYLEHYKFVLSQEDRADIVSSLNNIDNVKKYIRYIKNQKGVARFLNNFPISRDKDFFVKLISLINKDEYLIDLISFVVPVNDEDVILLIIDKIKNKKILNEVLCDYTITLEEQKLILSKLDSTYINKYIKDHYESVSYDFLLFCKNEKIIIEALMHNIDNNFQEYNEKYMYLFQIVSNYYELNIDHLIELAKLCGLRVLNYLENENIRNAINLNNEDFEKYLRIFDIKNRDINISGVTNVVTSLLQKKFALDFPSEVELFINTLHNTDDGKIEDVIKNINQVLEVIDINKYNLTINELTNGILSKNEQIILTFKNMTYEYLKLKRNEYVNSNLEEAIRGCTSQYYDEKQLVKYIFKVAPEKFILNLLKRINSNGVINNKKYLDLIKNEELLKELIGFKKKPSSYTLLNENIKNNMTLFNELCEVAFSNEFSNKNKSDEIDLRNEVFPVFPYDLLYIMSDIDVNKVKDTIFINDKLFEELLIHLDKYDMIGWGNRFDSLTLHSDITTDHSTLAAIINNYELISKTRKEKESKNERFTLVSELNLADCLNSDADIYSCIIGFEDYRLIKRNPNPNASPKKRKERIEGAIECMRKMHNRRYITVPPIDEDIRLKNGKTINIKVGNTNDSINLTYGERTGACMRIGGAGSSLFDFCLTNENGFHISFNDPVTGDLISRVSCFRNGNTLFLNQLRYSLKDKYTNNDVIDACKILCEKIIEMTKNSNFPIENVVASDGYALEGCKTVNIDEDSITKGMPKFYTDISDRVVVLATNNNGVLKEFKPSQKNVQKYHVGRAKVKKYENKKAIAAVKHIEAVDAFYSGVPIEDIQLEDKNVLTAYVGEDFYVAILEDGNIITYIQKNSLNSNMAKKELEIYYKKIEELKIYGGFSL